MEWFKAGGWGMFPMVVVGVFGLVVGLRAAADPTAKRLQLLKSLPILLLAMSFFTFGTNLWAVNVHLNDEAFVKSMQVTESQLPLVALFGVTEAGQALTLGGLMAALVAILRAVAEWRMPARTAA